ncbi:MAG TPA: DinB family protein [Chitinophagaceae bacterium]|nr:DinB family protein [Chitinophagaceae bacterium]
MALPTSVTTRLEYQHKSLLDIIDGLSDEQVRLQVIPGKWCIFENIVHLSTYQHIFINRIGQILDEEDPQFPRYTAESDPLFHDNCSLTTREIMHDLITTRRELIARILSLKEEDIKRIGTHPVFGKMNIMQWSNFFLLHEAHHLFTIFRLTAGLKPQKT